MSIWNQLCTALRGGQQPRHGRLGMPEASRPAIEVPAYSSAFSRPYVTLDEAAGLTALPVRLS